MAGPNRSFSLLIKPASADCNLACRYCFYLKKCSLYPETRVHRMSDEVVSAMIRGYMAMEMPQYAFGWQGGEPTLMGVEFFRRVTDLQKQYGRRGAVVSNGLQTNGTLLTPEFAKHLAEYRFLVGVSVDGPAEIHDASRRHAGGAGTHAEVMKGIGLLREHQVEFNILTLVNSENVGRPAEVYRYLRDEGFLFHQYIECVEFDEQGRLRPFAVGGEAWGDFMCGIYDEWMRGDTRRVSVRLFDSILGKLVDGVANVCHLGTNCCQYLVVEHNGDIYPCDFFVDPDLRLGNVRTHAWGDCLDSPVYRAFGERKSAWNDACAACGYLEVCAGDCPKNRFGMGRDPRQLSALCAGWKRFYAHAMPGFRALAEDIRRERAAQRRRAVLAAGAPPGRNDPCPCGSGRKFKKCCGAGA